MIENGRHMLLTTSGVAELLGIHSSTVKRWSDEGTLPTTKTEGGHRRIRLQDSLAAARERGISTFLDPFHPWEANVWVAISEGIHGHDFKRLHSLGLSWLIQGEINLLGRLLYETGRRPEIPFTEFLDVAVRGFMALVGEEWQAGRLGVGEEHMASQVVLEAFLRLRPGWEEPSARPEERPPVAIVGAAEGVHHDLGAQAVRILLERAGWLVYYLGPDVPTVEFANIQRAQGASLVGISLSPGHTLPDLQRTVQVLAEFYHPGTPYALALGGAHPEAPVDQVEKGPFEAFSLSRTAHDFWTWLQALPRHQASRDIRRVA